MGHKCAYTHCLHPGELVEDSEAIKENGRYYHWDCIQTKYDIADLRDIYIDGINDQVKIPVLTKVLNDLVFKYGVSLDYLKFCLKYYAKNNILIKSPFTLLYLRKNDVMEEKYKRELMAREYRQRDNFKG